MMVFEDTIRYANIYHNVSEIEVIKVTILILVKELAIAIDSFQTRNVYVENTDEEFNFYRRNEKL